MPVEAQSNGSFILATTTSTQDSGLLDVLVPRFEKESGIEVKVIAVGSGAALQMASRAMPTWSWCMRPPRSGPMSRPVI